MADKAIADLLEAESVTPNDRFLVEQGGTAKQLSGEALVEYLIAMIEGHGGITGIEKVGTDGLEDTYRITMVDGSPYEFTVTNGQKGDKGDNAYVWIRYASQKPTENSHSMGEIPDNWLGIYAGHSAEAPEDWTQYKWFEIKGKTGKTGEAAMLISHASVYQESASGKEIPVGVWTEVVPDVNPGNYLWTRTTLTFNTGDPVVFYSTALQGPKGQQGYSIHLTSEDSKEEDPSMEVAFSMLNLVNGFEVMEGDMILVPSGRMYVIKNVNGYMAYGIYALSLAVRAAGIFTYRILREITEEEAAYPQIMVRLEDISSGGMPPEEGDILLDQKNRRYEVEMTDDLYCHARPLFSADTESYTKSEVDAIIAQLRQELGG